MVRKPLRSAFLALAFLLLFVPMEACGEDSSLPDGSVGACHVFIVVDPNIGVMAMSPFIDLGSIQTGVFTGTIPFRIDANTEQVRIWTAASKLYKGDVPDPDSLEVEPIGFEFGSQIGIFAASGNPIGGEDNLVNFVNIHAGGIDGYPAFETEAIVFESAQNGHFSQTVEMVVNWDQDDPEKPMGEYSGKVKMLAEVVLP
jgi:hypothetical protein